MIYGRAKVDSGGPGRLRQPTRDAAHGSAGVAALRKQMRMQLDKMALPGKLQTLNLRQIRARAAARCDIAGETVSFVFQGRVWYLECWARAQMGDQAGIRRLLGVVAGVGKADGWSWQERYYSKRTGFIGAFRMGRYCEYPANFIRIVHRFLPPG